MVNNLGIFLCESLRIELYWSHLGSERSPAGDLIVATDLY